MLHPKIIYSGDYSVGAYDIDSQKRLSLPSLVRMMHEAAMQNVIQIGLSYWDLIPQQISWVLMRKRLELYRRPVLGESLRIVTHPAGFEKFFTYRDFKVYDGQGELIATSSSTWLLMNTVQRKMASIPPFILDYEMPDVAFLPHPIKKIPKISRVQYEGSYRVGWFELDWNEHLNNIHYLLKMLDVLPLSVHKHKELRRLDIIYKNEAVFGDSLLSQASEAEKTDSYLHRIIHNESGKELVIGQSYWE